MSAEYELSIGSGSFSRISIEIWYSFPSDILLAVKGFLRVKSSYKTTPIDQTSDWN